MTALPTAPSIRTRLVPTGPNTRLVTAHSLDASPLSCTAERHIDGTVLLSDVHPYRRWPGAARLLRAAADAVAAEFGVHQVAAVHPAVWDADLAGAEPLQRIIHMGTVLDADVLAEVRKPLPDELTARPLAGVTDSELAALSPEGTRSIDLKTWREVLGGTLGPLIPEASLVLGEIDAVVAAVGITEYRGTALVGHLVAGDRGVGLGRAVLLAGLAGLIEAGYGECRLNVAEDNWIARRLYRSLGFTVLRPPLRVSLIPAGGGRV